MTLKRKRRFKKHYGTSNSIRSIFVTK